MRKLISLLSPVALLGACTAGPDYAGPPTVKTVGADGFVRAGSDVESQAPVASDWWLLLGDPVLNDLEARALAGNPGVAAARARIDQARASLRQERANRLPSTAAQATTIQARVPGLDLQSGPPAGTPDGPSQDGDQDTLSVYNVGLNANWEIDFAGGQIRRIEAANAQAAASVANAEDAQVQLAAEVARAYVGLREAQARLDSAEQQRQLQQQTLELTYQRYTQGALALFPVGNANAELELLESQIAEANADVAVLKDTLAVLTGEAPGSLDQLLSPAAAIPLPPARVAVGDPAALIARRPDIRAAERMLAAANARIGVAEAARFPKLSFMGILGLGGTRPDDIFDLGNLSAIALPQLQWNLLDFGRTAASIDQAEAGREEALQRYREIVLRAFQDAEQSLARFGQQRANVAALAQIKRQADTAADLNQQRYKAGAISQADLNTSFRQRRQAEADLNRSIAAMTNSWIAIQKSLGLGWRELVTTQAVADRESY
ncbi:efflux transporter outer membrane subunit [Novosphingobium resinovorum]|uniref:efflux transporter outer membrane subunit n=1 Tax=Novosphingobium TaxID=165696 RepID=UPI001B3C8E70|nr:MULTISPECIES: efflux transporter outer membrane subunit [Novosphingobium]MBF7011796.1 efflux transporter outer membrane subunit [Novosphingobium sp. HR1a]WJM26549.1 efflux transporter outer membrane subunit [Novosphingobium resinovorum]